MDCRFCGVSLPDDANFCYSCGKKQKPPDRTPKKRGNGQGSVYKRGNKYVAAVTVGYFQDEDGKLLRKTRTKTFAKKSDAIAALPALAAEPYRPTDKMRKKKNDLTFRDVYDLWFPTCTAGKSTRNCYSAAFKHFAQLYFYPASEVDIDDLQECMDDCQHGKRTKQNMKTVIGLIYKYGVPRGYFRKNLILSDYLKVNAEDGAGGVSLPDVYLSSIYHAVGTVPGADLVFAHCLTGFRPSEFLSLKAEDYDQENKIFTGGSKTKAGKDRTVTISPLIQQIVDSYQGKSASQFFCSPDGSNIGIKAYRKIFYNVLESLKLDNPIIEAGGIQKHKYTPHSCRHTFATLMKRVDASSRDKLALIGHTSEDMLRHYQDAPISDLRKITDSFVVT